MAASVEGREVTATIIIDCQLDSEDVQPSGRSPATRSTKWKHQPTVPKPFNLGLDKRVTERKKFRKDLEKRQNDVDKREQIAKAKQDEEDKKELKEFRRSLDFKATPIRKYRDLTISPSNKDLTCPLAPPLATAGRRRKTSDEISSNGGSISPNHSFNSNQSGTHPA